MSAEGIAAAKAVRGVGLDAELRQRGLAVIAEKLARRHHIQISFGGVETSETLAEFEAKTSRPANGDAEPESEEIEERGDWAIRHGRFTTRTIADPMDVFLYNYPADTTRLSSDDLQVRDLLRLAKRLENLGPQLNIAPQSVGQVSPSSQAIHELHGIAMEVFGSSYSGGLACSEVCFASAKHFSDVWQRMTIALFLGHCCLSIEPRYAREHWNSIEQLIRPFESLHDRALDAYEDAFQSFQILVTYFTVDPEVKARAEEQVLRGFRQCDDHPGNRRKFLRCPDGVAVYTWLLDHIETNFHENRMGGELSASIVESADAVGRVVPWAQMNKGAVQNASVSVVESYLSDSAPSECYRRAMNVLALGEGLYEAQYFAAAAEVLLLAGRRLREIGQGLHAWHADILRAEAFIHLGAPDQASGAITEVSESELRFMADGILSLQADFGHFLLTRSIVGTPRDAATDTRREAESQLRHSCLAMSARRRDRVQYLRNLYFGMMMRRANLLPIPQVT